MNNLNHGTMARITDATLVDLQLANVDIMQASSLISDAIREPLQRHKLPGLLTDCRQKLDALIDLVKRADPDVAAALRAELRSTYQLAEPIDYIREEAAA